MDALKEFSLEEDFRTKILPLVNDDFVPDESINNYLMLGDSRTDAVIMTELSISLVSPNIVAERILQTIKQQPHGKEGVINNFECHMIN